MLMRTPPSQTAVERLSKAAAEIRETFASLKPPRVQHAEAQLTAARDARAEVAQLLNAAISEDRQNDRNGPARRSVELQQAQARHDAVIVKGKVRLEEERQEFRRVVDAASEPSLQAVDAALADAADIIVAAVEVLRELERFRVQNGITDGSSTRHRRRDFRFLSAFASEIE